MFLCVMGDMVAVRQSDAERQNVALLVMRHFVSRLLNRPLSVEFNNDFEVIFASVSYI